jgi:hypothetical protein
MKVKIRPHMLTVETVYNLSLNGEPVGMVIRLSPVHWVLSLEGRATRNHRDVVRTYKTLREARSEAIRLANGRPTKAKKSAQAKKSKRKARRRSGWPIVLASASK